MTADLEQIDSCCCGWFTAEEGGEGGDVELCVVSSRYLIHQPSSGTAELDAAVCGVCTQREHFTINPPKHSVFPPSRTL